MNININEKTKNDKEGVKKDEGVKNDPPGFKPKVLILGAGGIKGFFELGALFYLEQIKHIKNVNTFIGISIGAVISLLMVCGCEIKEIITHAVDTEIFQDFKNIDMITILNNTGITSNEKIKKKISQIVHSKFGFVPTLSQLYQMTGKTLISVTNNLTLRKAEYFSYLTEPNMSCVDSVMYSINIPGVFHKLCYRDNIYVDGALIDPYPLAIVDDGKTDILGIYIEEVEGVNLKTSSLSYLSQALLSPIRELREKSIASASKRCKHIKLKSSVLDTTGFTISAEEKGRMLANGHNEALLYMETLNSDMKAEETLVRASALSKVSQTKSIEINSAIHQAHIKDSQLNGKIVVDVVINSDDKTKKDEKSSSIH
ncbi:MAG: patatin-like phospholipase [Solumvirus sp.]|uniref:Patatin-like phospholipase n=1 Tax=Solumvirus sp. TaxID=2487773 RepID=A0A3G5AIZ6_9VIRU|nr:MAG: patatin-like phospholipase [Solumvirus sp.]